MVIAMLGIPFLFPAILSLNDFGDAMQPPYTGNTRGLADIGRGLGPEAGDERNSNVVQGVIRLVQEPAARHLVRKPATGQSPSLINRNLGFAASGVLL